MSTSMINSKEIAVSLMCDAVDSMNRQMAAQSNMPSEQIEGWIQSQKQQMRDVNGMLYDVLKQNGYIQEIF